MKKRKTGAKRPAASVKKTASPSAVTRTARAAGLRSSRRPKAARAASRRPDHSVFALAAECTIADIAPLKASLAGLLEHPSAVTLDVAAIQRIDTASMQLVAAFVRERESHGHQVEWRGSAPVFGSAARLLGLAAMLHLPDSNEA